MPWIQFAIQIQLSSNCERVKEGRNGSQKKQKKKKKKKKKKQSRKKDNRSPLKTATVARPDRDRHWHKKNQNQRPISWPTKQKEKDNNKK